MYDYDCLIIGGGPAGYQAAGLLAQNGKKVALVEEKKLGGCCLNHGCIPTKKALTEISKALRGSISWKEVMASCHEDIASQQEGMQLLLLSRHVEFVEGKAEFISSHEVLVEERYLRGEYMILATGAKCLVPEEYKNKKEVIIAEDLWDMEELPKKIAVIGGGVQGCEMASIFRHFCEEVIIVEKDSSILSGFSKAHVDPVKRSLQAQEINIIEGAERLNIDADAIFLATGRSGNLSQEDADLLGVQLDENGFVKADTNGATDIEKLFCIGDANGQCMLAHYATQQATRTVYEILHKSNAHISVEKLNVPHVCYTSPQLASVGMTADEAIALGYDVVVGKTPLYAFAMPRVYNQMDGLITVVRDQKSDCLLGACVTGPDAGEIIHILQTYIANSISCAQIRGQIFAHPSMSEGIKIAVEDSYPEGSVALKPKRQRRTPMV